MRPRRAAIGVACLVRLAGCNGLGLGPASPMSSTNSPQSTLPPGLTADGVAEAFTLSGAHADVLNASYTVRENREIRYANGTLYANETATTRIAADETRFLHELSVRGTAPVFYGGSAGTLVYFSNGTTVLHKTVTPNGTTYGFVPTSPRQLHHGTPLNDERIAFLFAELTNVTVTATDEATYSVRATGLGVDSLSVDGTTVANVTDVTFTATVTSNGLVREYRLAFTGELQGETVSVTEHVSYAGIGSTTVERPPWYPRAADDVPDHST